MTGDIDVRWIPPGPVAEAFVNAQGGVAQMIQGPIGGGKTSSVFMKAIKLAQLQRPSSKDGWRKFKLCVVHQTYRQLWRATIPSWWKWVPQGVGKWTGGKNDPASHEVNFLLPNEDKIKLTMEFMAIGDADPEDVLRGYEPTAFYLNEADLLKQEVYAFSRGRAGRYPPMDEGGPSWFGLLMDFNAPEFDTWLCDLIMDLPEDHLYFRQPGARDPGAENLQNLPEGYYQNQMSGQDKMYIRRMIDNKFGYSRDGKPVYGEDFNDDLHVAATPLEATPGRPLILGADAGRTPAAIVLQQQANGRWLALDEIIGENMGARKFGKLLNREMAARYPGFKVTGYCDPSAANAGDQDDEAWMQIVASETKWTWRPAPLPSNTITVRLATVERCLSENVDGFPLLQISPRCKVLRRGFNSGYKYRRVKVAGEARYHEEPDKNEYSHPHDGLQYGLLGGGEFAEVMGRAKARHSARRQTRAIDEACPQGEWDRSGGDWEDEWRPRRQAFAE